MLRAILLGVLMTAAVGCSKKDEPATQAQASGVAGKVLEVQGKVTVAGRQLATGDVINADDLVETGPDGSVAIELAHNGVRWDLGPGKSVRAKDSLAWNQPKKTEASAQVEQASSAAGRPAERSASNTVATAAAAPPATEVAPAAAAAPAPEPAATGGGPGGPAPHRTESAKNAPAPPPPPKIGANAAVAAAIADDKKEDKETTRAPEAKPVAPPRSPDEALRACLGNGTTEIHLLIKGTSYTVKGPKLSAAATKCVREKLLELKLDKTQSIEVDVKS